jgi:hypothetical protein
MSDTDSNLGFGADQNTDGEQSSNVNSTEETLQAMLKRLETLEAHQKTAQSNKDRGINQVQKEQQQLKGEFTEMKAYLDRYPDPADAERNWQMDKFLQANAQQGPPQNVDQGFEQNATAGASETSQQVTELLGKLGVDQNSPEFLANLGRGLSVEQAALATLATSQSSVQQDGVASGVSGGQGGGSNVQTTQEVLRAQYTQELDTLQKQAGGTLSPDMLYATQEKFARLGLEGIGYS